jgi:hypothetical protein
MNVHEVITKERPRSIIEASFIYHTDSSILTHFPNNIYLAVFGGDGAPMMQSWQMSNPQTVSIDKWREI